MPSPERPMRFRDWLLIGLVAGLFYSLVRYPLAFGCLLLVLLLIAGLVIWLFWQWVVVVAAVIAIVLLAKRAMEKRAGGTPRP